jgi:hypothetical protein
MEREPQPLNPARSGEGRGLGGLPGGRGLEYLSQKATDFVSSPWGTLTALGGHPRSTSNFALSLAQITQPGQTQSWKLFLDGPLVTRNLPPASPGAASMRRLAAVLTSLVLILNQSAAPA